MFFPQVEEKGNYDANGVEIDDVNSVSEYISIALGYGHNKDGDNGMSFHIVKASSNYFQPVFYQIVARQAIEISKGKFSLFQTPSLMKMSTDIFIPPPQFS